MLKHAHRPQNAVPPDLKLLSDYLGYGAQHFPERDAFVIDGDTQSYERANRDVNAIAKALIVAGIAKGDRVAMLSPPCTLFFEIFLATASIGAIWVGLNPKYSLHELSHPLTHCAPSLVFAPANYTGRRYRDELTQIIVDKKLDVRLMGLPPASPQDDVQNCDTPQWNAFLESGADISDGALQARRASVEKDDACLIVYTSGTTGIPKGAMITHRGLIFCSRTDAKYNLWADGQKILCNFPINHIACVGDVCTTTLVAGGSVIFMPEFDPAAVLEAIADKRITHLGQIPAMLQMELSQPDFETYDLSSLKIIMWGGNAASIDLVRRLRAISPALANVYGMTETTGNIIFARGRDFTDEQFANTIGFSPPEYEIDIFKGDDITAAANEVGEIYVRGEFLMKGYWRDAEATRAAFTKDGWLRTGDLAMRRDDGMMSIVGRRSEMFKSGGYNVYPAEVEQAIETHPEVAMATVVSIRDPLYAEIGHAFVIAKSGDLTAPALKTYCRERLANYKIPKRFTIMSELPMLPNGKIDKKSLKLIAQS